MEIPPQLFLPPYDHDPARYERASFSYWLVHLISTLHILLVLEWKQNLHSWIVSQVSWVVGLELFSNDLELFSNWRRYSIQQYVPARLCGVTINTSVHPALCPFIPLVTSETGCLPATLLLENITSDLQLTSLISTVCSLIPRSYVTLVLSLAVCKWPTWSHDQSKGLGVMSLTIQLSSSAVPMRCPFVLMTSSTLPVIW